jgi:DNA replication protein DnaC
MNEQELKQLIENSENQIDIIVINQTKLPSLLEDIEYRKKIGIDPNKGVLLMGPVGVGKTHTLRAMALRSKIGWGHPDMPTMFYHEGENSTPINLSDMKADALARLIAKKDGILKLFKDHTLYLDDLGAEEPQANHYGSKSQPIKDLLNVRYEVRNSYKTFITTNRTLDYFQEVYGDRIISRFYEMFNIIEVEGVDLRKIKTY